MLTVNYYIFIIYCLVPIGILLILGNVIKTVLLDYTVSKNKQQKYWNIVLVVIMSFLIGLVGCGITMVYFPMFQDIPQLISKDYSIVEGKVIHINSKIEEKQAIIAYVTIWDDITNQEVEIKKIYTPYMTESTYVKVAYLEHCKWGSFLEINNINVERKSYTGKIFVIIVMIVLNIIIIKYVLNLRFEKEHNKNKEYETLIYKTIHMRSFMFFELIILLQSIILEGAILGHHNTESDKIWTILLLIESINLIIMYISSIPMMGMNEDQIYYINFNKKYKLDLEDINDIEVKNNNLILVTNTENFIINNIDKIYFKEKLIEYIKNRPIRKPISNEPIIKDKIYENKNGKEKQKDNEIWNGIRILCSNNRRRLNEYLYVKRYINIDNKFLWIIKNILLTIFWIGLILMFVIPILWTIYEHEVIYMILFIVGAIIMIISLIAIRIQNPSITQEELELLNSELEHSEIEIERGNIIFTNKSLIIIQRNRIYRIIYNTIKKVKLADYELFFILENEKVIVIRYCDDKMFNEMCSVLETKNDEIEFEHYQS